MSEPKTTECPRYVPEPGDQLEDVIEGLRAERDWLLAENARLKGISATESKTTDWQPIATAPHDRRVLVYSPKYREQFVAFYGIDMDNPQDGQWVIARGKDITFIVPDASHWKELGPDPEPCDNIAWKPEGDENV